MLISDTKYFGENWKDDKFTGQRIDGIYFEDCIFDGVDFSEMKMYNITFINCGFVKCKFKFCHMEDVTFDTSCLKIPKFSHCQIVRLKMRNCFIQRINWQHCSVKRFESTGNKFEFGCIHGLSLHKVKFEETSWKGTPTKHSDFSNCVWKDCRLVDSLMDQNSYQDCDWTDTHVPGGIQAALKKEIFYLCDRVGVKCVEYLLARVTDGHVNGSLNYGISCTIFGHVRRWKTSQSEHDNFPLDIDRACRADGCNILSQWTESVKPGDTPFNNINLNLVWAEIKTWLAAR